MTCINIKCTRVFRVEETLTTHKETERIRVKYNSNLLTFLHGLQ